MRASSSGEAASSARSMPPDASLSRRSKSERAIVSASSASESPSPVGFIAGSPDAALANSTKEISPSAFSSASLMKRSIAASSSSPSRRMRASSSGEAASSARSMPPDASLSTLRKSLLEAARVANAFRSAESDTRS